jgi:glycosyltransferase involved in cell wall biosynthesis
MIRVAYIARATLYSSPGGDTKQVDMTASHARKLGVTVDVFLSDNKIPYDQYDLLHFFNVIRPADIIPHALGSGKPFVVSTIFLDYGEFEKKTRKGLPGLLGHIFSQDQMEYIKAIARWVRNGEKIRSPYYLFSGHYRSVRWVAKRARVLLPNSEHEYQRFVTRYRVEQKYLVVPNGIEKQIAERTVTINPKYENSVVCVARIEERKNQLGVIRALNNTGYQVYIHGKPSPNNHHYYRQCLQEAADNIHFTEWLSEQELYEMYHSARVHILASYFETTGLSSLEAAVMGCNIVITDKGDTRDYFGSEAWYCDPDDPGSIRDAVESAYRAPFRQSLQSRIMAEFTWDKAAEATLQGYRTAMGITS